MASRRLLFLALSSLVVGCYSGLDESGSDLTASEQRGTVLAAAPGTTVEVLDGVAAFVPAPGDAVTIEIVYDDGAMDLVELSTDEDGIVRVRQPDLGFTTELDGDAACASKCDGTGHSTLGHAWDERLRWRYNDAHRPGSVGKQATIDALKYAAATITTSRNGCSMADHVSATQTYDGTTSTAPNLTASPTTITCNANDGKNVVGWATNLASNVLGATCTWRSGDVAVETDAKYNSDRAWFAGDAVPSGCSTKFSLRAVASHEFGHAFGLGHSGCAQTMAPAIPPCESHRRKLGRGDVLGLRALY